MYNLEPKNATETFLASVVQKDIQLPEPITRKQKFLSDIIETSLRGLQPPSIESNETYSLQAQVADGETAYQWVAGDVTDLKSQIETKAEIDGYYEDMTVGNAEQLMATQFVEDKTPYKFRTTGGSADAGNRAYLDKIVGGTIAWNQQIISPDFSTPSQWRSITGDSNATISISANILTLSIVKKNGSNGIGNANSPIPLLNGHKILFAVEVNPSNETTIRFGASVPAGGNYNLASPTRVNPSQWTRVERIGVCAEGNTSPNMNLYLNTAGDMENGSTIQVRNFMAFDLTQMFGTTIADYIYSLETATPGAGVAWFRKLFPKDYYEYNPGELISVEGLASRETVGFNQWDEEWEQGTLTNGSPVSSTTQIRSKNFCRILPNTDYYATCGKTDGGSQNKYYLAMAFYDNDKQYISVMAVNNLVFTTPDNAAFFKIYTNSSTVIYGGTYNNDICLNFSWSGTRNSEYQPYEKHSYPLDDSLTLRGIPKLDANNNLYYDGDEYLPDGTVKRRYGIVDLGTLEWVYQSQRFRASLNGVSVPSYASVVPNVITPMYLAYPANTNFGNLDKGLAIVPDTSSRNLLIRDAAYTDAATFKAAMSGVMLIYELATPTTETADSYQPVQIVDDWGTEEFVSDTIVPVGHETRYPANLRDKLQHLPGITDSDGTYIIQQSGSQMSLVPLATATVAETLTYLGIE